MKRIVWILACVLASAVLAVAFLVFYQPGPVQQAACDSFSYENCPEQCVVCPPCEFCSSMACRSEEFCLSIGFNRSWYEDIKTRLPNTSG